MTAESTSAPHFVIIDANFYVAILLLRLVALYYLNRMILLITVIVFLACAASSATIMGSVLSDLTSEYLVHTISQTYYWLDARPSAWHTRRPVLHRIQRLHSFLRILDSYSILRNFPLQSCSLSRMAKLSEPFQHIPFRKANFRNHCPRFHIVFFDVSLGFTGMVFDWRLDLACLPHTLST